MATIYVRNVPDEVHRWLEREAAKREMSVAGLVRSLIKREHGLALPADKFAGIPRIVDGKPVEAQAAPVAELRLGGRAPGLYVDGEQVT